MGKLLENLIAEEIEKAFSILKRKKIIREASPPENDLFAGLPGDPMATDPSAAPTEDPNAAVPGAPAGGDLTDAGAGTPADPNADPMADPTDPTANAENPEGTPEEPEEEKDPIESAFDDIKELSDKTEDITKIVKIIKAKIQGDFDSQEEAEQLINKIEDEGSPLMKKALARPELKFARIQSI